MSHSHQHTHWGTSIYNQSCELENISIQDYDIQDDDIQVALTSDVAPPPQQPPAQQLPPQQPPPPRHQHNDWGTSIYNQSSELENIAIQDYDKEVALTSAENMAIHDYDIQVALSSVVAPPPQQPPAQQLPPQKPPPPRQPPPVRHRRGTTWSEEEHKLFLIGLEKYGKGDWRSISRYSVVSKTPCQVASHAQKYFIRKSVPIKKRKSIHDITLNETDYILLSRSIIHHNLPPLPQYHNHYHDLTFNGSTHFPIPHNPNHQNLVTPSQYHDTTTMGLVQMPQITNHQSLIRPLEYLDLPSVFPYDIVPEMLQQQQLLHSLAPNNLPQRMFREYDQMLFN